MLADLELTDDVHFASLSKIAVFCFFSIDFLLTYWPRQFSFLSVNFLLVLRSVE